MSLEPRSRFRPLLEPLVRKEIAEQEQLAALKERVHLFQLEMLPY